MKRYQLIPVVLLFISLSFIACKNGSYAKGDNTASADSTKVDVGNATNGQEGASSMAAVVNKQDTARKFVRTADLKFKVKNVVKSTYDIEDITSRHGGFVTNTNLASNVDNVTITQASEDSSLETTMYNVTNSITIRVPNTQLDTTLKDISRNIDYLDYRNIKAEDVALQLLSNKLTIKRAAKNTERLSGDIDKQGKKLPETTNAEEVLLGKQERADEARISSLSLLDQVNYSTITIYLYQRQAIKHELIATNKPIHEYEPSFFTKIGESFQVGWEVLESVIVQLAKLWALLLVGVVGYVLYVKVWRKGKQ